MKPSTLRRIAPLHPWFAAGWLCFGISLLAAPVYRSASVTPPQALREYRAAWVATVGNIDWPSSKDLTTEQQRAELIGLFDRAAELGLNVVIFQVRPACDAMYASTLEPWSEYLTGAMGKAPEPFYDPLELAVAEAHKRGLELHAWFNPYRARHSNAKSPVSANHISKTKPGLVREYGRYLWLDPGEKEVQEHSLRVVMDVVKRYDVDGVHFDDYFYPYKERAGSVELDFPDDVSWAKYGKASGLSRDDWRRENVNTFIRRVNNSVKQAKPWVKFGVSPFGIWRPGNPPQIRGFDPYEKLYADSRKWLAEGSVDYFAPQLYWAITPPEQSFPALLKWWVQQNKRSRHLVPGMDTTKVRRTWKPDEILNQIQITRDQPGVSGHIHWNLKSLLRSESLSQSLRHRTYAQPALVPALTWVSRQPPPRPRVWATLEGAGVRVRWEAQSRVPAGHWVVHSQIGGKWGTRILPGTQAETRLEGTPGKIAVRMVDRYGNVSLPAGLKQ